MRQARIRRRALQACLLAAVVLSAPARAESGLDKLKLAKSAYDYGDFAGAIHDLTPTSDIDALPTEDDRVEAWKVVGLSHFFLGKPTPAEAREASRAALFELLKQNPDYQLDPLFVPPDAIAFFESVRSDEEVALSRIRRFRNARKEQEALEREARRLATLHSTPAPPQSTVERKVAVNSPVIALMPFGLGQFQNGNNSLGAGIAAGQAVGALASIVSFFMIEVLRDPSGSFKDNTYPLAQDLNIAKWVGAGVFYGLWIAGGIEAAVHFVPERPLSDLPSAAPAGVLRPPSSPTDSTPLPPASAPASPRVSPPATTPLEAPPIRPPPSPPPAMPRSGDGSGSTSTQASTTP